MTGPEFNPADDVPASKEEYEAWEREQSAPQPEQPASEPKALPIPQEGDEYGGRCNRSACRQSGATWWNPSTRAYYCQSCALKINKYNSGLCVAIEPPASEPPATPNASWCIQTSGGHVLIRDKGKVVYDGPEADMPDDMRKLAEEFTVDFKDAAPVLPSEPPATVVPTRLTYSSVMEMVEATSDPDFTLDFAKQQLATAESELEGLRAECERLKTACIRQQHEIQQTLGKSLGYPQFASDQKNFPGATEADGVCVGDHVAESLASEAAKTIARQAKELAEAKAKRNDLLCDVVDKFMADALVAIAGAVCTPEKGYSEDGGLSQLLADIKTLRKQHDDFKLCYEIRNKHELSPQYTSCACPVCMTHLKRVQAEERAADAEQRATAAESEVARLKGELERLKVALGGLIKGSFDLADACDVHVPEGWHAAKAVVEAMPSEPITTGDAPGKDSA